MKSSINKHWEEKSDKAKTLYDKVFDMHIVRPLGDDVFQMFVGMHFIHEATSPQAFSMLRELKKAVAFPRLTIATVDHVIPTNSKNRPYSESIAEAMYSELEKNTKEFNIKFFSTNDKKNGIVHVIGPELGITQPGMTIVCGDSHTSTHGAFGALALGIGTSQIRDVLATQTIIMNRLKVRRIVIEGKLASFVTAKDVILHLINVTGPKAGVGYVYEFAGSLINKMSMDQRMTICNMAVEAGARCGYVNPDSTTFAYLKGRHFSPLGEKWDTAVKWWSSLVSDKNAIYDDEIKIDAAKIAPMVTWGINLGQSIPVDGFIPSKKDCSFEYQDAHDDALQYMGLKEGQTLIKTKVDVAFIGSCTNGRTSDFIEVAEILEKSGLKVKPGIVALAVPGSYSVRDELIKLGIDKVFIKAGFEFRLPGCSMCLAMNSDRLTGNQFCASSSNRNFKGRQGSPRGRTAVMSPLMVAAAAVTGEISDPREVFN
ncbi:3-isopropylmalate dehydratase large subunit [Pleurocapsa sp. PCC 7319]|uniref:3-isopropylmalate dehydratase large subunit n=1 Tax=Pleurocapsa sp. PCC 7319 TaxID=118161 RepID=UPI00034DC1A4|nr:3-isopropylmalate dehydratase large subunit [Pleurocapsa sp. PCC 7319]